MIKVILNVPDGSGPNPLHLSAVGLKIQAIVADACSTEGHTIEKKHVRWHINHLPAGSIAP